MALLQFLAVLDEENLLVHAVTLSLDALDGRVNVTLLAVDIIRRVVTAVGIVLGADLLDAAAGLAGGDEEAPEAEILGEVLTGCLTCLLVELQPAVLGRTLVGTAEGTLMPALATELHTVCTKQLVKTLGELLVVSGTMIVEPEVIVHAEGNGDVTV